MSNLSLLLAANPQGTNPASSTVGQSARQALAPMAWADEAGAARYEANVDQPGEYALPSGVVSMEHWLDLNA